MAFVDYYKILGVDKNIPQKDVRAAYRKRAKQFHPDLHPNDPKAKAKFQALNEAYRGDFLTQISVLNTTSMANNGRMLMHSAVSAELVVPAVPEAMVEQVEIHSRVSTSASLAEAEVSPASSKISSEVVAEDQQSAEGFGSGNFGGF